MITRIEEWIFPTSHPTLEPHDIHLWFVDLDRTAQSVERLSMALSADERARAARFLLKRHGRRFAVARGILRDVLSRYVGCDASRLVFAYDRTGKPTLGAGCGDGTVRFNVSHSHGFGLIGVARGREIGVDIEQIRPMPDLEPIAARCFSRSEVKALLGFPASQRLRAFFACWTRKEAYLTATGDGLARPLETFAVTVDPVGPARLLWVLGHPEETGRWSLFGLVPTPDTIGAVAVSGDDAQLMRWQWCAA
jgi:4'-phosphopantetheinyl transferase